MTPSRTRPATRLLAPALAALCILAALPALASADTTHQFLGKFPVSGTLNPQPSGVDANGNLIVWMADEKAIAKFDPSGNPVNFSGLGTNILDGRGGFDCPNTPSDCDRVSTNGFGIGGFGYDPGKVVAVDQTNGPQAGYIYVRNSKPSGGEVDVFDSTGRFKGKVDEAQAFPRNNDGESAGGGISLSSAGQLFIGHACCGPGSIDIYGPAADGIPSHMPFVGQIRNAWQEPIEFLNASYSEIVGDTEFIYASGTAVSTWAKYPKSEALKPANPSVPLDLSPTQCRCGADSGPFLNGGSGFTTGALDPANRHVYLAADDFAGETIQEWDSENHKIGPDFGTDHIPRTVGIQNFAFDRSGGPNDGTIYVIGSPGQIAKFGPPVVIPDLHYGDATPLHTTAHVEAAVDPLGAGAVTKCEVQYGTDLTYGKSVPCSPATPYAGETDTSGDISGLSTEGDYHYRFVVTNGNGTNPGPDRTFHTFAVLDTVTDPATEVDRTGATLNGRLNPDGIPTTYHFEYGIDTDYRQDTPDVSAGAGSGQAAIAPAEIENLQPGRSYHFRLVAENSLGTTYGNDQTFTAASSPTISGVYPTDVTETSAVLHASLDTYESDTTYRFEYGPTEDYGNVAPVPDGQITGSDTRQDVQVQLNGLVSGSTYFFRVVATNKWGTTVGQNATFTFFPPNCPNSHVRQTTASNYLPDCRAYELVSPGDAGAVSLFPGDVTSGKYKATLLDVVTNPLFKPPAPNARGMASNPPRFAFLGGIGAVAGTNPPNTLLDRYVATRTSSGWKTTYPGLTGDETVLNGRPNCSLSMDVCIDYNAGDPFGSGAFSDPTPHVWSVEGKKLGRWPTNLNVVPNIEKYISGEELTGAELPSPDFSHYVFSSRDVVFTAGGVSGAPGSAYDNDVKDRTVQVISKLPNGDDIPQDAGAAKEYIRLPAVSDDGSHILMSTVGPGETTHLYMRVDDAITYDVSKGLGVKFVGMSRDGSKVVFTSKSNLTTDDTDSSIDMFEWSEDTGSLTRVSQGNGNGDTDGCNAGWTSGCGVAPIAGERPDLDNPIAPGSGDPYFYSPEQLDPDNPGVLNERNLYVFREGEAQYVATFEGDTQVHRSQISPAGNFAAFLTDARLTGYDNEGWDEMYTYDVGTGTIRCASCIPSGAPPTIRRPDPPEYNSITTTSDVLASESGPFMADDGRVAFATADALVPQDTNGIVDVYEFVDSRPRLISAGTGQRDTYDGNAIYPPAYTGLESFSADGVDIYFSTYDTLAPEDHNGPFIKFYDARTNGGFPLPPPLQPCVAADECHGEGSATPAEPQVGTGADLGAGGNEQAAPSRKTKRGKRGRNRACTTKKCRKHRAKHRHRRGARLESRNG